MGTGRSRRPVRRRRTSDSRRHRGAGPSSPHRSRHRPGQLTLYSMTQTASTPSVLFVCTGARRSRRDITGNTPTAVNPQLIREVDVVVTLGREAHANPVAGTKFENLDTDEPSEHILDGNVNLLRSRFQRRTVSAEGHAMCRPGRGAPELAPAQVVVTRPVGGRCINITTTAGIVIARRKLLADGLGGTVRDSGHL